MPADIASNAQEDDGFVAKLRIVAKRCGTVFKTSRELGLTMRQVEELNAKHKLGLPERTPAPEKAAQPKPASKKPAPAKKEG